MKLIRFFLIAFLLGVVGQSAAQGQDDRDRRHDDRYDDRYDDRNDRYDDRYQPRSPRREVGFFYDELAPYGDWVLTRQYGWAWFPNNVRPNWRPYREGRWANSDYGWTWVTYEPFGWATYHYGRWAFDPRFGWLWVPGTIWGPAWVSWQNGGGYIGWAPLPPAVGFEVGFGIRLGGFDLSVGIRPDAYSFVPERSFLEARISGFLEPEARNRTIYRSTRNVTNYTYVDSRVVNRGIDIRSIERATGHRVTSLRVATDARAKQRTELSSSQLRIYRPERQKLDSVEVGPRVNAGGRAEALPDNRGDNGQAGGRPGEDRNVPEFQVVPRPNAPRGGSDRKIEKQQERAQQDLQRFQTEQKQRIDRRQQQELVKAKAQDDRVEVQKRHLEERESLQQAQQSAEQQLKERQKALRQARPAADAPKAEAAKDDQGKAKGKGKEAKPRKRGGGGGSGGQ